MRTLVDAITPVTYHRVAIGVVGVGVILPTIL